ncbi:MAG TPA: tRNA 2-thiocytidine biosynthesis protein TtcA [Chromatiales bacterium]|nr:tRNA 2-thiocytidine biosynthesis protein TtcA [Thiotrichales bacterium]HIP68124.1 tRNA 2-thiocytidine biosynthesis protein TtcA [Chromatiales bacterium]
MSKPITPPRSLLRAAGRAIADFNMIREGDRILLGISGGKDSLSLLHLLRHFQRHAPIKFSLGAVTIDPMSETFSPRPLIPYLASLGIDYHYVEEPIVSLADSHMENNSFCSFCARMKRGLMYKTQRENNYNVLALGQHLDDLAESFLMSAFHGGKLKTMKAHYVIDAGDLRVIRPLVYARERQLRDFADSASLPVIAENCPACFDMPTQREHMKQLLASEEKQNPTLFKTMKTTLLPLMQEGMPANA